MASAAEAIARVRALAAEDRRRYDTDPAYRAEVDAREAAERQREAERAREAHREARERVRLRAGTPRVVWSALEDLDRRAPAVMAVEEFLTGTDTSLGFLVLHGPPGVGKTVAACLALESNPSPAAAAGRSSPRFVNAPDLARASTYDAALWHELRHADPLVVDDLGTELLDAKGWALGNLVVLLGHRYDNAVKTIITTNLSQDGFRARYLEADGGRLADRLRAAGRAFVVEGGSRRRTWGRP